MGLNQKFWNNKRVLITGHTGFKGAYLSLWLLMLGANIMGISNHSLKGKSAYKKLKISKKISEKFIDIRNLNELKNVIHKYKPEIIFHLAAQSLVIPSYKEPIETYTTNINGTINILEACKKQNYIKSIILITSDKCYRNNNAKKKFKEYDALGGQDPYSSSKACAEIVAEAYFRSYYEKTKTSIITCRAGNVIGGGDWSEHRLFPDIVKSISQNKKINLRMPNATRPWQFVLEPLLGYLKSVEFTYNIKNNIFESFNFGPNSKINKDVLWVASRIYRNYSTDFIPKTKQAPFKESNYLHLCNQKAKSKLNWKPKLSIENAIDWTCEGYKNFNDPKKFKLTIERQINEYSK